MIFIETAGAGLRAIHLAGRSIGIAGLLGLTLLPGFNRAALAEDMQPSANPQQAAQQQPMAAPIAPGLIRLHLARNVILDVPRDWHFADPMIDAWIRKAPGDAIDIAANPTTSHGATELLLAASAATGKAEAALGLAFTVGTGDVEAVDQIGDKELQQRVAGIDAALQDDPAGTVTPFPLARFSFPGRGAFPAVTYTYMRTGAAAAASDNAVLVQSWSIWRPDGIVTLSLSYRMTAADKWSPLLHQIGDSLTVE